MAAAVQRVGTRAEGRHQIGAALGHEAVGGLVAIAAMLDGAAAGLDRVADALIGMGMSGNMGQVVARDGDGRGDLLRPVLDRIGLLVFRRGDGAGGENLDQVGALGQLLAGGFLHLLGAVGLLIHATVVGRGGGGDGQDFPGAIEPRSFNQPVADGFAHGDLVIVPAAHFARRGDAAHQQAPRRPGCIDRDLAGQRIHPEPAGVGSVGRHADMDVAVEEAGQQEGPIHVDRLGLGRRLAAEARDALPGDLDIAAAEAMGPAIVDLGVLEPHGSCL